MTFLTDGAGKADGVNGWIGVTDNDLLALLSRQQGIDEVNFWQPGDRTISKVKKGVGPSQLLVTARKPSGKGVKFGGISAFLMAREGR